MVRKQTLWQACTVINCVLRVQSTFAKFSGLATCTFSSALKLYEHQTRYFAFTEFQN